MRQEIYVVVDADDKVRREYGYFLKQKDAQAQVDSYNELLADERIEYPGEEIEGDYKVLPMRRASSKN